MMMKLFLNKIKEKTNQFIDDVKSKFEELHLCMQLSKDIPVDIINALLLDLDDYAFYAIYYDGEEERTIKQGYSEGEYDSGYFSNDADDEYIDDFDGIDTFYPKAKEILLG